ncbi:MAG TPA: hypothetical protein VNW92_22590 [Polyangiaceae bacterium]|nr:hypothetical protein [Polyangiaceae bacterium]
MAGRAYHRANGAEPDRDAEGFAGRAALRDHPNPEVGQGRGARSSPGLGGLRITSSVDICHASLAAVSVYAC